jgi:hypothetical protein
VLRGAFDQLVSAREIVGRDIKGAQIGDGENIDLPAERDLKRAASYSAIRSKITVLTDDRTRTRAHHSATDG